MTIEKIKNMQTSHHICHEFEISNNSSINLYCECTNMKNKRRILKNSLPVVGIFKLCYILMKFLNNWTFLEKKKPTQNIMNYLIKQDKKEEKKNSNSFIVFWFYHFVSKWSNKSSLENIWLINIKIVCVKSSFVKSSCV